MAHSKEAHGKHAAMTQFNEGHHEKKISDVMLGGTKYSGGEMNQCEEYKMMVDKQSAYLKKHKAQH